MLWLIGAGPMAVEYGRVLNALGRSFICITRSERSARAFAKQIQAPIYSGGLKAFLAKQPEMPEKVIVATGIEVLADCTLALIAYGVKQLLVEKPAGVDLATIEGLEHAAAGHCAQVFVAYNRRFYESVLYAEKLLNEDGGIKSLVYELTEWSHLIADHPFDNKVKHNWFLANTSHVVDLAFYFGGRPTSWSSFTAGAVDWHHRSANFAGAGLTQKGALFSYHGNWQAPGRWSLELLTQKRRLIFRPMEQLQVQLLGSVEITPVEMTYAYDQQFKPGVYLQTANFLEGQFARHCGLAEHVINARLYCKMADYEQ
ncbi:hypothetical protein GCM10009092_33920 [Bowmanella denitrificans]|uniref:Gfo/Idh/MocA-like oxidoreductase N-terminal domain-containing protein n=1 Tax=Bowmanella denitrificans TaxID=366582 RepID=A0ABP3HFB5_9ALTE